MYEHCLNSYFMFDRRDRPGKISYIIISGCFRRPRQVYRQRRGPGTKKNKYFFQRDNGLADVNGLNNKCKSSTRFFFVVSNVSAMISCVRQF